MKFIHILFGLLGQAIVIANAKTYLIVDDRVENCGKKDQDSDLVDFSNFELIVHNDTHTFVNGSITCLKAINSPWIVQDYAEHFEHGKWLMQGYNTKYDDFCKDFHDQLRPWYYATKNLKGCPIPAGHVWNLDMIPIEFPETLLALLPTHYMGQWRLVTNTTIEANGKVYYDCRIGYGEIFMSGWEPKLGKK